MRKFTIVLVVFLFTTLYGCMNSAVRTFDDLQPGEVNPGEIKMIPYSKTMAVGTDSTIMFVNRDTGEKLSVVYRSKKRYNNN